MSHAIVSKSLSELRAIAVDVLWREWQAVGGSAASRESWRSIVDPEAIVLATLFLAPREPRLDDILFSWVELHAPLLSAQRLKNLQRNYPPAVAEHVAAFVAQARTLQKNPRWRSMSAPAGSHTTRPEPAVHRAAAVIPQSGATLMLRLRTALGVGVKADVLTVLLGSERPLTVAELAQTLGYTKVGVRTAVADLDRSGFIIGTEGRPTAYAAPIEAWQSLLQFDRRPIWGPWHHWFALVVDLTTWYADAERRNISDYALDVWLRDCIKRHPVFFHLTAHEQIHPASRPGVGSWEATIASLVDWGRSRAS